MWTAFGWAFIELKTSRIRILSKSVTYQYVTVCKGLLMRCCCASRYAHKRLLLTLPVRPHRLSLHILPLWSYTRDGPVSQIRFNCDSRGSTSSFRIDAGQRYKHYCHKRIYPSDWGSVVSLISIQQSGQPPGGPSTRRASMLPNQR